MFNIIIFKIKLKKINLIYISTYLIITNSLIKSLIYIKFYRFKINYILKKI